MSHLFSKIARSISRMVGQPWAFIAAVLVVTVWAAMGPYYHYDEIWQLVINTGTTIVTFLLVFLIANAQNRDTLSLHLKLDEIIRAIKGAHNSMIDLDRLTDEELDGLQKEFASICARRGEVVEEIKERCEEEKEELRQRPAEQTI